MTENPQIREIRAVLDEADRDCRIPGGLPIDEMPAPAVYFDRIRAIVDSAPPAPTAATWSCARCGSDRWVGWRAGPEHEGWPRKAQCVPCGHVQALPATAVDRAASARAIPEPTEGTQP